MAGSVETVGGYLLQVVPTVDDVVAVHDEKLLFCLCLLSGYTAQNVLFRLGSGILGALYGSEFTDHYGLQLLVVYAQIAHHHPRPHLGLGLRLAKAGVDVHILPHLVPFHDKARAVGAENAVRAVVKVGLRVVSHFRHHLGGVVAGPITIQSQTYPSSAA